jgi:hypothetical protein
VRGLADVLADPGCWCDLPLPARNLRELGDPDRVQQPTAVLVALMGRPLLEGDRYPGNSFPVGLGDPAASFPGRVLAQGGDAQVPQRPGRIPDQRTGAERPWRDYGQLVEQRHVQPVRRPSPAHLGQPSGQLQAVLHVVGGHVRITVPGDDVGERVNHRGVLRAEHVPLPARYLFECGSPVRAELASSPVDALGRSPPAQRPRPDTRKKFPGQGRNVQGPVRALLR